MKKIKKKCGNERRNVLNKVENKEDKGRPR